jgi:murein DD-endopeptidase MepM/ murein hydrolase activator NlpD
VQQYQIKKGDTLWDIATKFQVSMASLMAYNQLSENSILTVGDAITIPTRSNPVTGTWHVVKSGETMWDIAFRYKLNVQTIVSANPSLHPENLQIGDRLSIPDRTGQLTSTAPQAPSRGLSFSGVFSWPLVGTITSGFGWRKSGFHHGLDIAGDIGDPIRAAAAGKVIFAGYRDIYGRMVILEHLDGKQTIYAHAQKIKVKENQKVRSGQVIATVGISGRTTGPHLHFEVRDKNTARNPLAYLRN